MTKLTGQELVKVLKEETNASLVASKFDRFVNSTSVDSEGFIGALKEDDESVKIRFSTIALLWIKKGNYQYKQNWFDLRNKYAMKTSSEIYKLLGDTLKNFFPQYDGHIPVVEKTFAELAEDKKNGIEPETESFEELFVEDMARSHRTLQQAFSGVVFKWLSVMDESMSDNYFSQVGKTITTNLDDRFYFTPFI